MAKHIIGGSVIDDEHPLAVSFDAPGEHLIDGGVINEEHPLAAQVEVALSGPAGGDLAGTYPDPSVAKVDGVAVDMAGAIEGDVLTVQEDGSLAPAATASLVNLPSDDEKAALTAANSPSAENAFATLADVGEGGPGLASDIVDALEAANSPSSENAFATIADVGEGGGGAPSGAFNGRAANFRGYWIGSKANYNPGDLVRYDLSDNDARLWQCIATETVNSNTTPDNDPDNWQDMSCVGLTIVGGDDPTTSGETNELHYWTQDDTPSEGDYTLNYADHAVGPINYDAAIEDVQGAFDAAFGEGNTQVEGEPTAYSVQFSGAFAGTVIPLPGYSSSLDVNLNGQELQHGKAGGVPGQNGDTYLRTDGSVYYKGSDGKWTSATVFAGAIASDSVADLDDSGWAGGVQNLLSYRRLNVEGTGQWNVIQIGGKEGPLGAELIYDPYSLFTFASMGGVSIGVYNATEYETSGNIDAEGFCQMDPGTGFWVRSPNVTEGNGQNQSFLKAQAKYFPTSGALSTATVEGIIRIDNVDTSKFSYVLQVANGDAIKIDQSRVPSFPGIPASDPGIAGQLFTSDGGGELATNLGNDARLVMVSAGS